MVGETFKVGEMTAFDFFFISLIRLLRASTNAFLLGLWGVGVLFSKRSNLAMLLFGTLILDDALALVLDDALGC